jgi:hypothetical protein
MLNVTMRMLKQQYKVGWLQSVLERGQFIYIHVSPYASNDRGLPKAIEQ